MKHRTQGYALLEGKGVEIGAFNEPAILPAGCIVSYFDAIDPLQASERFPEIDATTLVPVDVIGDIDKRDLRKFGSNSQDFTIAMHVIEHVACPIAMIEDMFHITRPGGYIAIAAPDKRFTFDRDRSLTSFEHLEREYEAGVDVVDDSHYMDFLRHVGKHVLEEEGRDISGDLAFVRSRREHAHVWDSESFLDFLENCKRALGIEFEIEYSCNGDANSIEYFAMLRKVSPH